MPIMPLSMGIPNQVVQWYEQGHDIDFIGWLFLATLMLIWPWIFFGVVWQLDGLEMQHNAARIASRHTQDVAFFVTTISNGIGLLIGFLFGKAVSRLAQKWVVHKDSTVAHVSLLTNLKNRSLPTSLFFQRRLLSVFIVVFYMSVFALVPGGITALLTPVIFPRHTDINGTELDFGSTNVSCIDWFNNNIIPHTCDWTVYKGANYTECLEENQLVDVLDAARGSILSQLSNNPVSLTYTQLGAVGGLHLLGSTRGMLPIGPNGIPAFDTLSNSSFTKYAADSFLPYNYSLDLQGILSEVSCVYDTHSPVLFSLTNPNFTSVWNFDGTCPSGQDFLGTTAWNIIANNNTLGFWACNTSGNSYEVYLRGDKNYADSIGNITCIMKPIQPAVFKLDYTGQTGVFNSTQPANSISPGTSTELIRRAVAALGNIIWEAQNSESNLVVESVITYGVKSFQLPPYAKDDRYLQLYEAMIGGMIDYLSTYIRLLYSTKINGSNDSSPAPTTCVRTVNGTANYEVFGWVATRKTAAYLIPVTLASLTTLVILAKAMSVGNRLLPRFDPTDPESLVYSADETGDSLKKMTLDKGEREPGNAKVLFGNRGSIVRLWVKDISNVVRPSREGDQAQVPERSQTPGSSNSAELKSGEASQTPNVPTMSKGEERSE